MGRCPRRRELRAISCSSSFLAGSPPWSTRAGRSRCKWHRCSCPDMIKPVVLILCLIGCRCRVRLLSLSLSLSLFSLPLLSYMPCDLVRLGFRLGVSDYRHAGRADEGGSDCLPSQESKAILLSVEGLELLEVGSGQEDQLGLGCEWY